MIYVKTNFESILSVLQSIQNSFLELLAWTTSPSGFSCCLRCSSTLSWLGRAWTTSARIPSSISTRSLPASRTKCWRGPLNRDSGLPLPWVSLTVIIIMIDMDDIRMETTSLTTRATSFSSPTSCWARQSMAPGNICSEFLTTETPLSSTRLSQPGLNKKIPVSIQNQLTP